SRSPRAATGHDRLARSSRRSPSGGAAGGFWIRAWSHASPLFKQPAAGAARYDHRAFSRVGWTIPFPITRKATHVRSNACCGRLSTALVHALGESEMLDLLHIARSFAETRCPWLLSPPNKALATAPFPSGMVGRF